MSGALSTAIVVHPRFAHALAEPPCRPAAAAPRSSKWNLLPFECLEMIAAQLDKAQDLLALSAVCRDSRRLVAEPSLWRQLCRRRFGVPTPEELGLDEDPSATCPAFWTQLYRYNHSVFRDLLRSTERPGGARLNALGGADGPLVIQMQ